MKLCAIMPKIKEKQTSKTTDDFRSKNLLDSSRNHSDIQAHLIKKNDLCKIKSPRYIGSKYLILNSKYLILTQLYSTVFP